MRKALLIFILLVLALCIAAFAVWTSRAALAAKILASHLKVPVSIESLDISKTDAHLSHLWIGNPPNSRTHTAFTAEAIDIETTLSEILSDPLIIDEIRIQEIFVGIENYNNTGTETNWTYLLESSSPKKEEKSRDYLIRTLILENLTVELTYANGKVKRYPTIQRLELHNISSETGFPVKEIEKAIFNLMMQNLLKKLDLQQFIPKSANPLKYIPGLLGS